MHPALDRISDVTKLGQCRSISSTDSSGLGAVNLVPFPNVLEAMTTFGDAATYTYPPEWNKAFSKTVRAVNRLSGGSGTLTHGQAVLYDVTNGKIYESDAVAASADSPLFQGIVQGMRADLSDPANPVFYPSNQAVPYGYEFDLFVQGFCEGKTSSDPSAGVALVTGSSGGALITATTSHIPNIVAKAISASVSNLALIKIMPGASILD